MISHTAHAFASSPMISHVMRPLHRTPTDSRATRVLFTSHGGDFAHCARFCIVTDVSHAMRPFTSPGGDFAHCARFCIVTDVSHALRPFPSPGGDFAHCACFCPVTDDFARPASFCIARRRILTLCVLLHRPAMISHSVRVLFISPADDFARRVCFYTKGREKDDFKGSDF